MAFEKLQLYGKIIAFYIPYSIQLLRRRVASLYHKWTYKVTSDAKNVVVLGGSWAGIELTRRLSETLPTGYKVVLVEKNSHFNYTFTFPRFSVLQGHEYKSFIPYHGIAKYAPDGIFSHVRDSVENITTSHVHLASGDTVAYEYLAIATGSSQPPPARVISTDWEEACSELQSIQESIKTANKIAIVGGGAVGIELATDIKDFYQDKDVTLIHSRGRLLNQFGERLHDHVLPVLQELKIRTLLNERPRIPGGVIGRNKALVFSDASEEMFDLVIPCTGQRPNSSFATSLIPSSISKETSGILVKPTLQVQDEGNSFPRIFALGDVAEHGGPKMARAGYFQAGIVLENILSMIKDRQPSTVYTPRFEFEGAIKLTLGKTRWVMHSMGSNGSDFLLAGDDGKIDLDVQKAWKSFGVDIEGSRAPATAQGESIDI
ncbi:Apoptosis-inducing factor 2 [Arachnomyces sp. PD_36]|nr:Apoptosis-inducing factor 2 [Arachnomyces sp. PD_36]